MSDTHVDDQSFTDDDGPIQQLRQAAREGKAALAKNAELERRLLFSEAGVDTTSEVGAMLLATHEGTDINELKERAARLGALKANLAPASTEPTAEELARQEQERVQRADEDRRRAAAQGGFTGGMPAGGEAPTPDPRHKAIDNYFENVKSGKMTEEQARIEAMAEVLGAAQRGDKRMFFDSEAHAERAAEYDRINLVRPAETE